MASTAFVDSSHIHEPQNDGTAKFQDLEITGCDGYSFPHHLASSMSSFASNCNHTDYLVLDCDGILMLERDNQKYIVLCELKSSFGSTDIVHAKDQLVASYVKLNGVLSTLQGYKSDDYIVYGVIVSFEPTQEQLNAVSKMDNYEGAFSAQLAEKKKRFMPASKCNQGYSPLNVGDFNICYVPVPGRNVTHSINLPQVLGI